LVREVGIQTYGTLNLLLSEARASAIQEIIKVLPASMGSLIKMLTDLSNKPTDIKPEVIYKVAKFFLENDGYKGLPSAADLFPVGKYQ
jgi:hypothetical protein